MTMSDAEMDREWKPSSKVRPQSCVLLFFPLPRLPPLEDPPRVALLDLWPLTSCRTMAQAFSSALDSAFMLDSDVNHLSLTIDQK